MKALALALLLCVGCDKVTLKREMPERKVETPQSDVPFERYDTLMNILRERESEIGNLKIYTARLERQYYERRKLCVELGKDKAATAIKREVDAELNKMRGEPVP